MMRTVLFPDLQVKVKPNQVWMKSSNLIRVQLKEMFATLQFVIFDLFLHGVPVKKNPLFFQNISNNTVTFVSNSVSE